MNHYVYQITNNLNGKIYIGKRSCRGSIEDDKYFGSGTALKSAIKKYGKENFTKIIIDVCETDEQAYELEALIVDDEFLKRTDIYNLCGGGIGGGVGEVATFFGKTHSDETRQKISANSGTKGKTGELCHMFGKTRSDETKAKISAANKGKTRECHSDEHKAKISAANKGKTHSSETKAKISANHGMKGKKFSPESIVKRTATRQINKLVKQAEKFKHIVIA